MCNRYLRIIFYLKSAFVFWLLAYVHHLHIWIPITFWLEWFKYFNLVFGCLLILIIVLLLFFLFVIFAGFIKGKLLNTFILFLFFRKSNLFAAINGFRKLSNYIIFINHKSSKSILFACKDIYLTIIFFNLFFFKLFDLFFYN